MKHTAIRTWRRCAGIAFAATLLSGCGAWQAMKETTTDTAHALFATKVKTMHLVIKADANLNPDDHGASLPVALRVYQLKHAESFEAARYAQWLDASGDVLGADVVTRTDVTLGPGATITLDAPMAGDTTYVGVVAFFRTVTRDAWRVRIPVDRWKQTDPVMLGVSQYQIQLSQ
jgi:type VI secretion system protein VasD